MGFLQMPWGGKEAVLSKRFMRPVSSRYRSWEHWGFNQADLVAASDGSLVGVFFSHLYPSMGWEGTEAGRSGGYWAVNQPVDPVSYIDVPVSPGGILVWTDN